MEGALAKPKLAKNNQRMVHIRLHPELHRRLRIVVAAEDTSMQDWLVGRVENAVAEAWPNVTDGENKE